MVLDVVVDKQGVKLPDVGIYILSMSFPGSLDRMHAPL
jgi:hypothetical protein